MSEAALAHVRDLLKSRSAGGGLHGLRRIFRSMDSYGSSGKLDKNEFSEGLKDYGVEVSNAEMEELFRYFDRDGDGTVSLEEFFRSIKENMTPAREELVKRAFAKMDVDGNGYICAADIRGVYSTEGHPQIESGEKTQEEVLQEFINNFQRDGDDKVTYDEFLEYYGDLSFSIDNEEYWTLMMTNAWKL